MSSSNNTTAAPNGIVLFWYRASPYGRRLKAYLTIRNIHHAECFQPPIMPRPDQSALGVQYRRSPIMAIGRDIYLDTRLSIAKLEEMFPPSPAHVGLSSPETKGLEALLQNFVIGNMFVAAARQIPLQGTMLRDPKFQKDRATFYGPDWRHNDVKMLRPEGTTQMRYCFDVAESLLADDRKWIAGTKDISLADLEGVWVFDWFIGDLRPIEEFFGAQRYPKVHAWRNRYRSVLAIAKERASKTVVLSGGDAIGWIIDCEFSDTDTGVDARDPTKLQEGDLVEVFPLEGGGGYTHQDRGRLMKLTKDEVAISVESSHGREIRLHAPRYQFRVKAVNGARL